MKRFLQMFVLTALLAVPWVANAQVACDEGTLITKSNADTNTATTSYMPAYCYYNYSYSEVIVPAERLMGIGTIKALQFLPATINTGNYYNNCEIYLANVSANDLNDGFIQNLSLFRLVYTGSLNFSTTDWQTIVFDSSFYYDGVSNLLVAVRRNHGSYETSDNFAAYNADANLGRYVYQDGNSYTIGDINGGTATNIVAWYKFIGCDDAAEITCNRVTNLHASSITTDGATITWSDELNGNATYSVYNAATGEQLATGLSDTTYTITSFSANTVYTVSVSADCGADDTSVLSYVSFRTECGAIDSLPWFQGFEDEESDNQSVFVNCMNRFEDGAGEYNRYPYVYSWGSAHTGSKCLYWYHYNSSYSDYGTYHMFTLPLIDTTVYPINTLQVKFWALYYSNPETIEVGTMSDPNDRSTFVPLSSVVVNSSNYTEYTVALGNAPAGARCIAINYVTPTEWESGSTVYMDDITIEAMPNCMPLTNLAVRGTTTNSALISWENRPGIVNEPEEYNIAYLNLDDSTATPTTATTTETHYAITGLTAGTAYRFWVAPNCGEDFGVGTVDSIDFTTRQFGCAVANPELPHNDTVTGSSTTTYYFPTYSCYNYSLGEQIYTMADLGGAGMLTSISMMPTELTTNNYNRTIEIYLANTTENSLSDFIYPSDLTLVYSGTTDLVANEWYTFTLDEPFNYSGSNLLVLFRDMTGVYGCSNYWASHTIDGSSCYIYQDGSPYDLGTTGGSTANLRNDAIFNFLSCVELATCAAPAAMVTDVQSDEITITWVPGADETEWDVYYRVLGDTEWIESTSGISSTTYTVSDLNGGTTYEIRVVNDCTDGLFESIVSATTFCAETAPLPLTENFQLRAQGSYARPCWTTGSTFIGTQYPLPSVVSLQGAEDNNLCLFFSGGYMILPKVDADLSELELSFKLTQGGDNVRLLLGLLPDLDTPIDSMIVIDTMIRSNIDSAMQTVNVAYRFEDIDEEYQNYHIAFWDAFADNYSFIDDLVLDYIPSCSPVSGLSVENVTVNSADISWTVEGESASSYTLEYGPAYFTPGTGTLVTDISNPVSLTGINHSTTYDVYIYTECASLDITSAPSQVVRFTTPCAPIVNFPYVMNFENITAPGSTDNILPNCWVAETLNGGYAPYIYHSTYGDYASSPTHCLYTSDDAVVALPELGVSIDSLMISFHLYNSYSSYALAIGTVDSVTPGFSASFVAIDTLELNYANYVYTFNYHRYLSDYTGTATRLAFKNFSLDGYGYSYNYIDDIVIDRAPTCIAPQEVHLTNRTNVSADLAWNISQADNYSIEYGPHGFVAGTGTTLTSTTRSVSLTGLTPATEYDVRIIGLCSAADISDTAVFTFTTMNASPVTTLPYFCDFSDSTIANAWELASSTNKWFVGDAVHYGATDSMSLYISSATDGSTHTYNNGTTSVSYAFRSFELDTNIVYGVSFNWIANGESNYDYIRAFLAPGNFDFIPGILPDGSTSMYNFTTAVPAGWIDLGGKMNQVDSWQNVMMDAVTVPTPGVYNLVFMWGNDGGGGDNPPAAIDNVEFFINTCPAPANIVAISSGTTYMNVDWNDGANAEGWQIEYGPAGFVRGTGTIITSNTHPVLINGLDSLTNYDIYIRSICADADTGNWGRKVTLSTSLCDGATEALSYDPTMEETTTTYLPLGTSCYNYSYTQTLIPASYLASLGSHDITALAFNTTDTYGSHQYNGMNVYLANVSDSNLNSGWIMPDSIHTFVQVVDSGNFSHTDLGWNMFGFDTTFTWDGYSNVLVAINRLNGEYSCSSEFSAHTNTSSDVMAIYTYRDGSPYDISTVTNFYSTSDVGDLKLIACSDVTCDAPVITETAVTETTATVVFAGDAASYQVGIVEGAQTDSTFDAVDLIPVRMIDSVATFTFDSLTGSTTYTIGVRSDCGSFASEWVIATVTTEAHPCFVPTTVTATNVTVNSADISWTVGEEGQTQFELHVFGPSFDQNYTVTGTSQTVTGLANNTEYGAAVRAICAEGYYSDWSDTLTFTTTLCQPVTGVTVSNITNSGATVSWTAGSNSNGSYEIEYDLSGFTQGSGNRTTVTGATTYTITGLDAETPYDVYVRSICAEGVTSAWSTVATFTTLEDDPTVTRYDVTVVSADPAMGSASGSGSYVENTTATVTANANPGYHFVAWMNGTTEVSTANPYTFTVTSDITLTATFEANPATQYTVTLATADATMGSVSPAGASTVDSAASFTATATANPGYHFVAWMDAAGATFTENPYIFTVTSDVTLTATFEANPTYNVTVVANDSTMGVVTGGGAFEEGATIMLTATAFTGYHFVSWSNGANTASISYTVEPTDTTFIATFAEDDSNVNYYTVTVDYDTTMGTVTGAGRYAENSVITLTAVAYEGYQFVSWSTGETTASITLPALTGNVNLVATFEEIAAVCEAPTNLNYSNVTENTAVLNWTSDAAEWQLGLAKTSAPNDIRVVHVTTNPYTVSGLEANTSYDVKVRAICGAGDTSAWSTTVTFTTQQTQGIDDVEAGLISLYPNPASTTVTLTGIEGAATVTVVDMNGRVNGTWTVENGELTIDVTGFAQGAYFVRIVGEQSNAIRKLIVR